MEEEKMSGPMPLRGTNSRALEVKPKLAGTAVEKRMRSSARLHESWMQSLYLSKTAADSRLGAAIDQRS